MLALSVPLIEVNLQYLLIVIYNLRIEKIHEVNENKWKRLIHVAQPGLSDTAWKKKLNK